MTSLRDRIRRDERGASLILAIAFMLVAGGIGAGVTASVTSGINDSHTLSVARDREYSAEGAIDAAIVHIRGLDPASIGLTSCGGPYLHTLNQINIRVDCEPAPEMKQELVAGNNVVVVVRHNVIFVACVDVNQPCGTSSGESPPVIRAQVNFQVSGTPPTVTRTFVQSWSVNG